MMKHNMRHIRMAAWMIVAALASLPMVASAQTLRGDFNMDGSVSISDAMAMINCLSNENYGELTAADRDTITVNGVPIVMVRVKGGTYTLKYGKVRTVPDFWIAQTELTVKQWTAVMGQSSWPQPDSIMQRPKFGMTWYESQDYIERLNVLTGRNFRLPYADEWTFAASGGKLTRGYIYCGGNDIDEVAWYYGNLDDQPIHRVATKKPNELGLYDMSGNASEWVQEMREIQIDGTGEIIRTAWAFGGCISSNSDECRPTSFFYTDPSHTNYSGVRLAIPVDSEWRPEGWPVK